MSKAIPFGRFLSKAAARANAQRIFEEHLDRGRIPTPDADDVNDLLNNHPDKVEKVGPGVAHFCVEPNEFGGPCFIVVRIDGTKCEFTLGVALAGEHPNEESQLIQALRHEIWEMQRKRASPDLVKSFIASEPSADWRIKKTGRGVTGLVDRELARRWNEYYRAHA